MSLKRSDAAKYLVLLVIVLATSSAAARKRHSHKNSSEREQQCREARHPIFIVPGEHSSVTPYSGPGTVGTLQSNCSSRQRRGDVPFAAALSRATDALFYPPTVSS